MIFSFFILETQKNFNHEFGVLCIQTNEIFPKTPGLHLFPNLTPAKNWGRTTRKRTKNLVVAYATTSGGCN